MSVRKKTPHPDSILIFYPGLVHPCSIQLHIISGGEEDSTFTNSDFSNPSNVLLSFCPPSSGNIDLFSIQGATPLESTLRLQEWVHA